MCSKHIKSGISENSSNFQGIPKILKEFQEISMIFNKGELTGNAYQKICIYSPPASFTFLMNFSCICSCDQVKRNLRKSQEVLRNRKLILRILQTSFYLVVKFSEILLTFLRFSKFLKILRFF